MAACREYSTETTVIQTFSAQLDHIPTTAVAGFVSKVISDGFLKQLSVTRDPTH